LSFPQTAV